MPLQNQVLFLLAGNFEVRRWDVADMLRFLLPVLSLVT